MVPYGTLSDAEHNCIVCTSLGKSFNFTGTSHANIIIPDDAIRGAYITQRNSDHYGSLSPFMRAALLGGYTKEGKEWIDALMEFPGKMRRSSEILCGEFSEGSFLPPPRRYLTVGGFPGNGNRRRGLRLVPESRGRAGSGKQVRRRRKRFSAASDRYAEAGTELCFRENKKGLCEGINSFTR